MTIRAALTTPTVKRLLSLAVAYVLSVQAMFGAGAQLRVMLDVTPGLCTILGFQQPDGPKHASDACAVHCVGQVAQDGAPLAAQIAVLMLLSVWTLSQSRAEILSPRAISAFQSRAPPR